MTHNPIELHNINLLLPHKTCFAHFSAVIRHGQRIAVMGNNGCGKSSLLTMLLTAQNSGHYGIDMPLDAVIGYVPQMVLEHSSRSGAERFQLQLSRTLACAPNLLLLDEPTNHLDSRNRKSLIRMLQSFSHTLVMATHDTELLRDVADIIWHIDDGRIEVFFGSYDDYMQSLRQKRANVEAEIRQINQLTKGAHDALMKEQVRAKNSRRMGEKNIVRRKWPTVVSGAKARRAEVTSGRKKMGLKNEKIELMERLSKLRLPEDINPKFHLASPHTCRGMLVSIRQGAIGYESIIVDDINLSFMYGDRIGIIGDNGSGKSTLLKALLNQPDVKKSGEWQTVPMTDVGYLGQHYENLDANKTVLENISDQRPEWLHKDLRKHLNDFLFRKNEEVNALVKTLSGGEKARLSVCKIAASAPKLLLLDEITNNVDLTTREHLIEMLKVYSGTLVVISHDQDFLYSLGIRDAYVVGNGMVKLANHVQSSPCFDKKGDHQ